MMKKFIEALIPKGENSRWRKEFNYIAIVMFGILMFVGGVYAQKAVESYLNFIK
jgi:hypothetical protein